jgi:mannose-6-phosphate isomerase-like protein (cupin superfamily)
MEPLFRHDPPADLAREDGTAARRLRWLHADRSVDNSCTGNPTGPMNLTTTMQSRGYESVEDPVELSIALRELYRVRTWIGEFADVAAEMPGFAPETVMGVKSTAAMVTLLIERAEARMRRLTRPNPIEILRSPVLTLDPGQASAPRAHKDCDVILVVLDGAADLLWWDGGGTIHRIVHQVDRQVRVRLGTRYSVVSSGDVPTVVAQVRVTAGVAQPSSPAVEFSAVQLPDGAGVIAAG